MNRRRLAAAFAVGGARYDELRPGYPAAAVDWMVGGTPAGGRVADIGAGTGKLTTALVGRGFDVVAVDPSADMLAQLRRRLPTVATRIGTGERTGLDEASVDLATFAQSWHWVDPDGGAAELRRIVRPGGAVAMVWNLLDVRVAWVAELTGIWHSHHLGETVETERAWPRLGDGFGEVDSTEVEWQQPMAPDALAALVTTRSYYLSATPDEQDRIREGTARFVSDHVGDRHTVAVPYRTVCHRIPRI